MRLKERNNVNVASERDYNLRSSQIEPMDSPTFKVIYGVQGD